MKYYPDDDKPIPLMERIFIVIWVTFPIVITALTIIFSILSDLHLIKT